MSFSTNIISTLEQNNKFICDLNTKMDTLTNAINTNGSLDGIGTKLDQLVQTIGNQDSMNTLSTKLGQWIEATNSNGSLDGIGIKLDHLTETIRNRESMDTLNTNLERLINTISTNGLPHPPTPTPAVVHPPTPQTDRQATDEKIRKRNQITEQITRNELLSELYQGLIEDPQHPFAPQKFRTRVNKNTSELELKHRRLQTIGAVNTEIQIMKDRVTDWKEKVSSLETEIEQFMSEHEIHRGTITEGMRKHDTEYRTKYVNENVAKMKEDFNSQKANLSDFLLKVVDEDRNDTSGQNNPSKNGFRPRGRGRGYRGNNRGQWS